MDIVVKLSELQQGFDIAMKTLGTESHGHEGIKIYASKKNNRIKLSTTDGDHSTEVWVDAKVKVAGKVVIDANKAHRYIAKLDVKDIHLFVDDKGSVIFKSRRGKPKFMTYDSDSFPTLPKLETKFSFKLSGKLYKELINGVSFCTKKEDKNSPTDKLEGINLISDGEILNLFATDGHGVAHIHRKVKASEMNVILTKKSLVNSARVAKDDEKVTIQATETRFMIKIGNSTFHIPVLSGIFPPIEKILPKKTADVEFNTDKQEFLSLLERSVVILDKKGTGASIKGVLHVDTKKVTLEGQVDGADFSENIVVNSTGSNTDVRFDVKKMIEIVKNMNTGIVRVGLQDRNIYMKPEDDSQTCLLSIG